MRSTVGPGLYSLALGASLAAACLFGDPRVFTAAEPLPPPVEPPSGETAGAIHLEIGSSKPIPFEYSGADLATTLREIARNGGMNIVVSPEVRQTVSLYFTKKSPLEAIRLLADAEDLTLLSRNGVWLVKPKHPNPENAKPANAPAAVHADESGASGGNLTAAVIQTLLDSSTSPEMAKKTAEGTRRYFEALMAEGFSREEALRIVSQDAGGKGDF
jgi:type II secretory pathway component GspD/PulD (secretin)